MSLKPNRLGFTFYVNRVIIYAQEKDRSNKMNTVSNVIKSKTFIYILAAVTFVLITVTAIMFEQSFIRLLPLYASIIIRMLHSRANRYGYLFGGVNQLLYALTYLYYHLYSSMLYALLVSFPLQIVVFITWSRKSYKSSTEFKSLTPRGRLWWLLSGIAAYAIYTLVIINTQPDANQPLIDSASFMLGIVGSALTILSYREYTYLSVAHNILSLILYVSVAFTSPDIITYVIFTVYAVICSLKQFASVKILYTEQQATNAETQQASDCIEKKQ